MRSPVAKSLVGVLSAAFVLSTAYAVYANCGACEGDAKPAAETTAHVCAGCAEKTAGQVCVHCTSHKLGLSEAEAKKIAPALEAYNKKIAAAQKDLLAKVKESLGAEKSKKLAAALKPKPKK